MNVVLLPHHDLVETYIEEVYTALPTETWEQVIIVSPDHFHTGPTHISPPAETEHGFTLHRDYVEHYLPDTRVKGFMLQNETTEAETDAFVEELLNEELLSLDSGPTLYIFSIDFSHYLPGQIAYVHDLRSQDVLRSRSVEDARSLEVDSPVAVEVLLKLLEEKNEVLEIVKYTNPSKDIGVETFENTTHIFACSRGEFPSESDPSSPHFTRALSIQMFFAHPEEWYEGRTVEDRYLYGYDEVFFSAEQDRVDETDVSIDRAIVINHVKNTITEFTFDYFK